MRAVVYTETVVHSAAERFLSEVPYQLVIVTLEDGGKLTARMCAGCGRASIGDAVELDHERDGVAFFRTV